MPIRRFFAGLFTVFLLTAALPAQSFAQKTDYTPLQTTPQDLSIIGEGTVAEIVKPDLIRLDTGVLYVLDNIRVPPLYTDAALAWLEAHMLNQPVTFYANPTLPNDGRDRLGNRFGHAVLKNGDAWVQGKLVSGGLAWADSTTANRDMILPLLALEDAARKDRRGFWAAPGMAPRTPETIGPARNVFAVIEGTVFSYADKHDVFFLNFGEDWKTDLTLVLTREDTRNFPRGYHIADLVGKKLRMRGWITERNGPNINLTHPEQIEQLGADALVQKKAP